MPKWIIFLLALTGCVSAPQGAHLDRRPLYVNTRAVIELNDYSAAATIDVVESSLKYAEYVFKGVGVKFVLTDIEYSTQKPWAEHIVDGTQHPNSYNIYFVLAPIVYEGTTIVGASYIPRQINAGTSIISVDGDMSTVAHEIGHGLGGLEHTFDEDGCSDTPTKEEYVMLGDYTTYPNLMNYHRAAYDFITPQQEDLMRQNILRFSQKRLLRHYKP